jgi:hypothetical protein
MAALFYFHVPKTAGTSITDEIRQHFLESQILTENGNLTLPFLEAHGKQRLRDVGFIHGHPGVGAAAYLEGIADAVTLLRNPMEQVISNYLHVSRGVPQPWHRAANALGFRDFLRAYPEFLVFQTLSLAKGLGFQVPPERVYDALPHVLRYLESTTLLGTVEQIDEFMASLASMRRWPAPVSVRHINRAEAGQRLAGDGLEETYAAAARSTDLGALIAIEQAVYAKARSIVASQRVRRSMRELGETARRVWRSESGEIVLGHNFGLREMIDGEPAWWTLEAHETRLYVATRTPATLHADVRVWHAVDPSCIELWTDERRLDARIEQTSDGFGFLQVPLAGIVGEDLAPITLRIVRKFGPDDPPWYPALLLYRFRLT